MNLLKLKHFFPMLLFVPLSITGTLGCQDHLEELKVQVSEEDLKRNAQKLLETTEELLNKLPGETKRLSDSALKEIENLRRVEYRVVELPHTLGREEIELELQELGQERWDCFQVVQSQETNHVVCKRLPRDYLRHLGQLSSFWP